MLDRDAESKRSHRARVENQVLNRIEELRGASLGQLVVSHELLLEAAVFLVSLKLIQMARKNSETEGRLEQRLIEIQEALARTASYGASDRA